MEDGGRSDRVRGFRRDDPASHPHKGHNEGQLQRHCRIIGSLDGRQIQAQRESQGSTEKSGNPDYRNASDGKPKRESEGQAPGRDPLPQPLDGGALCCRPNPAHGHRMEHLGYPLKGIDTINTVWFPSDETFVEEPNLIRDWMLCGAIVNSSLGYGPKVAEESSAGICAVGAKDWSLLR